MMEMEWSGTVKVDEETSATFKKIADALDEQEDRALKTAIAYTRYLKAKHPQWSAEKLQRRVAGHLNIKFV